MMSVAAPFMVLPDGTRRPSTRDWVPEAPVALEYNGFAYAVMMATPEYLVDFTTGFALSEGLAASAEEVTEVGIAQVDDGWIVRAALTGPGAARLAERVRSRVAESSCGLCGMENLAEVARPLPMVEPHGAIDPEAIFAALEDLPERQELNRRTGAAHAAAWVTPSGRIAELREDVGRHNALDKLIGGMARTGWPMSGGFVLSTARCSYEIVEKAVKSGATTLVTVSLPTSLAVERARAAGLSLWVLARGDSVTCVNDAAQEI